MNELCYEPLSAAYFEVMAQLWADSEVIRYTAVERPCTPAQPRPGGGKEMNELVLRAAFGGVF